MNFKTNEIRHIFLDFFKNKNHEIISGNNIIPKNDDTLLFINAGMNQFKNIFLGKEKPVFKRITTLQNCLRTGGKHNDFNHVGYTNYHHTFFEMLGNFSFNDYSKEEAILFAWELMTNKKWFNIDPQKLWITVHVGDVETYQIWKKILNNKLKNNIFFLGSNNNIYENENFWQMGEIGPCGFCTEIFYQHTKNHDSNISPSVFLKKKCVEIWNIVFMQFYKNKNNTLNPLTSFSIDTGMGLERISSVLQKVKSSYEIDIFKEIINEIYNTFTIKNNNQTSIKIIADHIRSASFIIANGVLPSNEGRGYVVRRIIRRALRHGHILGIKDLFFYKIVPVLIRSMQGNNKILINKQKEIEKTIYEEEKQFFITLENGIKVLNKALNKLKNNTLNGAIIFQLYDTFGFPVDLTEEICKEKKIKIDHEGFIQCMNLQKSRSKKFKKNYFTNIENIPPVIKSKFIGYNNLSTNSKIIYISSQGKQKKTITSPDHASIILNQTTFFGESSGQIGDKGTIYNKTGIFEVYTTTKQLYSIVHFGKIIKGHLNTDDNVIAKVHCKTRRKIQANHSATHLLHSSLRYIINDQIFQKGSFIDQDHLRFDFNYYKKISLKKIFNIEKLVNKYIQKNILVEETFMELKQAKKLGVLSLFESKYSNQVRVLSIGSYSKELCGGTHVLRTGEIGYFKIIAEQNVSSGIRRIEAVTGDAAIQYNQKQESMIQEIKTIFCTNTENIIKNIKSVLNNNAILEKKLQYLNKKNELTIYKDIVNEIKKIGKYKILIKNFTDKDILLKNQLIQSLRNIKNNFIMIFTYLNQNKLSITVTISNNLLDQQNALTIFKKIICDTTIKGGGSKKIACGGGKNTKDIKKVLFNIQQWKEKIIKE
ncbi:Alanine--tRNA ligase [Buchnera aphidicola (Thelaxes suberi)]|uniref:alanine--tRNA ligase n=1 Tax=Buchnera aphidicola TaxID=9 RepID=UPI003464424A